MSRSDDDLGRGGRDADTDVGSRGARERRMEPRYPAHLFPTVVTVRVRPGIQANLVDLSASGAQLDTGRRLMHGRFVHVQFLSSRGVTTVRARVVRNHVGTLSACLIRYRSGVRFDRRVSWPSPAGGEGPADGSGPD